MKLFIWPIMILATTSASISAQAHSPSFSPTINLTSSAPTVVKRFSTKGYQVKPRVHSVVNSKKSVPSASPALAPRNTLSALPSSLLAPQQAIVSPVGRWLNHGFSWINSGLGLKAVKPWQKATLAEPVMTSGVAPALSKFATKIFISKEATLGGNGVAGGGCGCK